MGASTPLATTPGRWAWPVGFFVVLPVRIELTTSPLPTGKMEIETQVSVLGWQVRLSRLHGKCTGRATRVAASGCPRRHLSFWRGMPRVTAKALAAARDALPQAAATYDGPRPGRRAMRFLSS